MLGKKPEITTFVFCCLCNLSCVEKYSYFEGKIYKNDMINYVIVIGRLLRKKNYYIYSSIFYFEKN